LNASCRPPILPQAGDDGFVSSGATWHSGGESDRRECVLELRLIIAYSIIAVFILAAAIATVVIQRRRAARKLRMRGVKVEQGSRSR